MIENYLFVVNPSSGKGKCKQKFDDFIKLFPKTIPYSIFWTTASPYFENLNNHIKLCEFTKIIAVGGDGTISEVAAAAIYQSIPLGILPFGSGNDIARVLKLPKTYNELLNIILSDSIKDIDYGMANEIIFVNFISFGLDAEIVKIAQKKKNLTALAYFFSILEAIKFHKPSYISVNSNKKHKIHLLVISNGKYYGGGMLINPFAKNNDGLFDSCVIKAKSKLTISLCFPSVIFGWHRFFPFVNISKDKKFLIEIEKGVLTGIDGEIIDLGTTIEIELFHKQLKVLI